MITKEQALNCKQFRQVAYFDSKLVYGGFGYQHITNATVIKLDKPVNWRANGKCKTWKRSPDKFCLPIKHGLYNYGYITEENCHLFEAIE